MDALASWDHGVIGAVHPIQSPTNANMSTSGQELLEVPSKGAGSKSIDPTKGSNAAKLQTAVGSVSDESHDDVFSASISAKASVIASAVSSMMALIAAATIAPVTRKSNFRSTFLPGIPSSEARLTSAAALDPRASSLFQGYAPWPKEGPRFEEEDGGMEVDESTTGAPAPAASASASGSVRSEHAAFGSTRTSQRRHISSVLLDSSSQGASAEDQRGAAGEGGATGKVVRGAQMEMGSSSSNQPHPGWKYVSVIFFSIHSTVLYGENILIPTSFFRSSTLAVLWFLDSCSDFHRKIEVFQTGSYDNVLSRRIGSVYI